MTTFPRDAELLRRVIDSRLLDVHTAMTAQVKAFDATAQTVDVQPMVKNVISDPDGTEKEESYPLLRGVPIQYPRSGAFVVVFPLEVGDIVTVVFQEWPIGYFRKKGVEVHPVDLQRHGFSGAVAHPGGPYPESSPVTETIDGLIVGHDGGALLRIKDDGTIAIGATASTKQAIALADDVEAGAQEIVTDFELLRTAINAWVPVPTDGGAALKVALVTWLLGGLTTPVADVGSSKVTVEE